MLLASHLHSGRNALTGGRDTLARYEALFVSAGTATSERTRGEANSFNVLRLDKRRLEVERFDRVDAARRFVPPAHEAYRRDLRGWAPT